MSTGAVSVTGDLGVWEITSRQDITGRVVQVDYSKQVAEGVRRHDHYRQDGRYVGTTYELEGVGELYDRYGKKPQRVLPGPQSQESR